MTVTSMKQTAYTCKHLKVMECGFLFRRAETAFGWRLWMCSNQSWIWLLKAGTHIVFDFKVMEFVEFLMNFITFLVYMVSCNDVDN